jgi:hypothetical protein
MTMRKDSDNLAMIEQLKPKHATEMNRKIKLEAELERGERDVEELLAQLESRWGTRDLDKIREIVRQNYEQNTQAVDEFAAALNAVSEGLAAIEARA